MVPTAWPEPSRIGAHLSIVAPPAENRLAGDRSKVMIPATIVCPDGITHACMIRNMSLEGAKLAISRRHRLPLDFALAIPGCDHAYPVTRKWQRGDFAGVVLGTTGSNPEAG